MLPLSFFAFLVLTAEGLLAVDFHSTGELGAPVSLNQKPSAKKDQTAFATPYGLLNFRAKFEDTTSANMEVSYGQAKDITSGRAIIQVEKLFLQIPICDSSCLVLAGQIANPWIEMEEREFPDWYFLGSYFRTPSLHWNSIYRADNGMSIVHLGEVSRIVFSVTNGEGAGMDETGPRKDLSLHVEGLPLAGFRGESRFFVAVNILQGAYEDIDAELAQRERWFALAKFELKQRGSLSLEGIWTKDPVDKINKKIADEVDLTDLGGLVVRGQGAALNLEAWLNEKTKMSLRAETLNPALGVDARGLSSQMLGFHFFPRQNLQFSLAWLEVKYEQNHNVAVRDLSALVFGARLHWTE